MTYQASLFGSAPRITCDGCGVRRTIDGLPPAWFFAGKGPPGWRLERNGDERRDYCGTCKKGRKR
jgi:hypothetical protein